MIKAIDRDPWITITNTAVPLKVSTALVVEIAAAMIFDGGSRPIVRSENNGKTSTKALQNILIKYVTRDNNNNPDERGRTNAFVIGTFAVQWM